MVLLPGYKMTCWGGALSDGVYRLYKSVLYLKNFGILFTKQGFNKNITYIFLTTLDKPHFEIQYCSKL
jgi:hypothetical protein